MFRAIVALPSGQWRSYVQRLHLTLPLSYLCIYTMPDGYTDINRSLVCIMRGAIAARIALHFNQRRCIEAVMVTGRR